MKKIWMITLVLVLIFSMAACGQTEDTESTAENNISEPTDVSETTLEDETEDEAEIGSGEQTPITLTIGDTVLDAYLNDSAPAQSLIAQLPLTVSLNDSDNDFCGDNIDIEYTESDVTSGYQNGDLAFWTPANNFVIFVSGEENSVGTGNLVKLGRITSSQEMLDTLEGSIEVTIALNEDVSSAEAESESEETDISESTEATAGTQEGAESMQIKITVGETNFMQPLKIMQLPKRGWRKCR